MEILELMFSTKVNNYLLKTLKRYFNSNTLEISDI